MNNKRFISVAMVVVILLSLFSSIHLEEPVTTYAVGANGANEDGQNASTSSNKLNGYEWAGHKMGARITLYDTVTGESTMPVDFFNPEDSFGAFLYKVAKQSLYD